MHDFNCADLRLYETLRCLHISSKCHNVFCIVFLLRIGSLFRYILRPSCVLLIFSMIFFLYLVNMILSWTAERTFFGNGSFFKVLTSKTGWQVTNTGCFLGDKRNFYIGSIEGTCSFLLGTYFTFCRFTNCQLTKMSAREQSISKNLGC